MPYVVGRRFVRSANLRYNGGIDEENDVLTLLTALVLGAGQPPALQSQAAEVTKKDPIVCKGNRSSRTIGSNVIKGRTCKLKSEWQLEERHARRELQTATDRWKDPTPIPGAR